MFGQAAYDPDRDAQNTSDNPAADVEKTEAEGRKAEATPPRQTVTSTPKDIVAADTSAVKQTCNSSNCAGGSIDFAYVRSQVTMEQVLEHLGYFDRLRGSGTQRRGPCPIHGSKRTRGNSFSVHLGKGVFQCFHPPCKASGNVLDFWCALHNLTAYDGARHLAATFDLELTTESEKRNP